MSNIIPDITHPHDMPYCIWHPDVATEDTYRKLSARYPELRYQVGRACAVAGYVALYKELDLLPDVHIAEEARDNGCAEIYDTIMGHFTKLSQYIQPREIARVRAAHAISGTTEHTRTCTVDGEELNRDDDKSLADIDDLHCFESGSPADEGILVYDVTSVHSFLNIAEALEQTWALFYAMGPHSPLLNQPKRPIKQKLTSRPPIFLATHTAWAACGHGVKRRGPCTRGPLWLRAS